ncbi:hypothetical protein [Halanaerobaculum tunisiense]
MLDENYIGQRSNREKAKNVHIFSGLIECLHWDQNFLASPEQNRKSEFKPSIYRYQEYALGKAAHSDCPVNNVISETNLGPFIKMIVDDKKVIEIEFINGLKHRFIWQEDAKGLKV